MKRTVTVKFKDGNQITVEPKIDYFGLFVLEDGMVLNVIHGDLYKQKGNVICGGNITNEVDTIVISVQY